MKARKIMIAVFAAVLAVQMTGCNKDIDTNKPVVIDVSVSDGDVESKAELTWTELGNLTDCAEIRETVDIYFNNAKGDDGLKYGPFYIDTTGTQCTNNTLKVVLGNRYVAEMFATGGNVDIEKLDPTNLGAIEVTAENTEGTMLSAINNSLDATYTDLSDSDRTPALFNAYFNLLPDSTPNYFNGGDVLSRAEAMALVTRATTPVMSLPAVDGFEESVTGTDFDQYINYAAQQNDNSYINTSDKSLTPDNFKGAMSRAEFIYLVMNNVYGADTVQAFDTSEAAALKDCTNAGDLSTELGIADADRCNGYTLKYSLDNVDKGVCEELYGALAMAVDKGVITPETRWNEGVTKAEAITILINAFSSYYDETSYLINSAEKGSTAALEADAEALWSKQDVNDLSCTKEEFISAYVKDISNGMTPEQFEQSIEMEYSIKAAEEIEAKEQEAILKTHIKALWEKLQDKLTCDETTFSDEYKSQRDAQGDSFTEDSFTVYILDKYGIPEETTPSNNNTGGSGSDNTGSTGGSTGGTGSTGGSTGNTGGSTGGSTDTPTYTPPVQDEEPVYTPPADTGSGSNDSGSTGSGGNLDEFMDDFLNNIDPDAPDYELG